MASVRDRAEAMFEEFSHAAVGRYALVEPSRVRFLSLCELADRMDEEFFAEDIQLRMSPEDKDGVICFDVCDVTFEHGNSDPFFQYIRSADRLRIFKKEDDVMEIQFVVRDLWVKA